MNYLLKPISFKKYSLILVYCFFFMAVFAWCMEFYFEKISGDLTRIGNFPERYFGWQALQPSISPEKFKDYSIAEADILVIGDSFSISRAWQSKLIANNLKVCTIVWQDLGTNESLQADLGNSLRAAGFKGHYVIIESIERFFQKRLKSFSDAHPPIVKQNVIIDANFPIYPHPQRERISFNKLNGADWGVKALVNSIKLSLELPDKYLKSGNAQAVTFNGCTMFSHRLCDKYAIFVDSDFEKETFDSIGNVLIVNKNLKTLGIQPIWLVIPDKSTVYLGYGELNKHPYHNIWQEFAKYPELTAPDVASEFIKQSRIIKDFYMPNDTHLSTNGFLYLGDLVNRVLSNMQANKGKSEPNKSLE